MYRSLSRSFALLALLAGCSATPLTPNGGGGFGVGGKRGTGGSTGVGASGPGGPTLIVGGGGSAGPSGAAASSGGPTGAAASSGGPTGAAASSGGPGGAGGVSGAAGVRGGVGGLAGTRGGSGGTGPLGTGGTAVDASGPDPWSYRGQHVTKVDVQRCPPYYGCDVCTLTLAGSAETVVPNLDYALPNPSCYPPSADAGTDASSSQGGIFVPPPFCGIVAPDGGAAMITEIVLQPDPGPAPIAPTIPNATCQFLPGPTIAEPAGCLLTTLENEFCVSDCLACP